jgi:hypothetical protein
MMAPELIIGLCGSPSSVSDNSLKPRPLGSPPDVPVHGRGAVFLHGQAVVDRLAQGLHAKQVSGVTDAEALSVDGADRDPELLRIHPA